MQGLAALGLEPAESRAGLPLRARLRSRARDATAPNANPGLLGALLNGVVGILSEPVRHVVHGALLGDAWMLLLCPIALGTHTKAANLSGLEEEFLPSWRALQRKGKCSY